MSVALRPVECLFIDKYKAIHGRISFKMRFDGTDRQLKSMSSERPSLIILISVLKGCACSRPAV